MPFFQVTVGIRNMANLASFEAMHCLTATEDDLKEGLSYVANFCPFFQIISQTSESPTTKRYLCVEFQDDRNISDLKEGTEEREDWSKVLQ